ncbi:MAG: hypothetical protein IJW70_00300 [Clostridia bacterium]|nr:hypothetical protein [Clostridia bacterium]
MNEYTRPTPAKKGTVFYISRVSVWRIIKKIISIVIENVLGILLATVLGLIPIVGGIIAIVIYVLLALSNLFGILDLILYCVTSTKITSTGICGFDENNIPFDLPAKWILGVSRTGRKVYIEGYVVKKNGKTRDCTIILRVAHAEEFVQAYRDNRIKMVINE